MPSGPLDPYDIHVAHSDSLGLASLGLMTWHGRKWIPCDSLTMAKLEMLGSMYVISLHFLC